MINRLPFHLLLGTCLLVLLAVMVWLSHSMLDAERRRLAETHQIRLVEQSRLALWRMDSLLAAMIAGENNRSPGEYFQEEKLDSSPQEEAAGLNLAAFARLYFQIDPQGNVSSPQTGREQKEYAAQLARTGMGRRLMDSTGCLPEAASMPQRKTEGHPPESPPIRMKGEGALAPQSRGNVSGTQQDALLFQQGVPPQELAEESQRALQQGMEDYNMRKNLSNSQQEYNVNMKVKKSVALIGGKSKSTADVGSIAAVKEVEECCPAEEERRDLLKVRATEAEEEPLLRSGKVLEIKAAEEGLSSGSAISGRYGSHGVLREPDGGKVLPESYRELSISSLQPSWHREQECLLTRRISDHGHVCVQGIWLDWNKLKDYLLQSVSDILPEATLVPAGGGEGGYLTLAGIPALLNPGSLPEMPGAHSLRTVWNSVAMAWGCGLLALGGVIGFMIGILRLSERRAVFVSAVTHELRTPLTTFNMYTEMLSSGLVPKGREMAYVDILKNEASRLTHLVDNVLSYARVEKNAASLHPERIPVPVLANAVLDRISPRLAAAGMDSQLSVAEELQEESVTADMTAVEQILYNLADNAAKYAQAEGSILKLELRREKRFLMIRVQDEGKGISDSLRGKLFRPFSRSAEEAAGKQPGVGLGLALSQELARSMGGELWLEESSGHGCRFALKLPLCRE